MRVKAVLYLPSSANTFKYHDLILAVSGVQPRRVTSEHKEGILLNLILNLCLLHIP